MSADRSEAETGAAELKMWGNVICDFCAWPRHFLEKIEEICLVTPAAPLGHDGGDRCDISHYFAGEGQADLIAGDFDVAENHD